MKPIAPLAFFVGLTLLAWGGCPMRGATGDPAAGGPDEGAAVPADTKGTPAPTEGAAGTPSLEWKFGWEGWGGLQYKVVKHLPGGGDGKSTGESAYFDFSKIVFQGKFGAKLAGDVACFWNERNVGPVEDGLEVRRARLYWAGDVVLLRPFSFSLEAGLTGRTFTLEESYIVFTGVPGLGSIKAGQFQAPMSLEAKMSSRDLTFMESSSAVDALAPGNNTGIQVGRPAFGERMTWVFGFFTNAPQTDTGDATRAARRLMGRLTWVAWEGGDGPSNFLHIGLSGSYLFAGEDSVQYRSRPESHLAPYMVDTGPIKAQGSGTLGFEGAWVRGPISAQGEYLQTWVNRNRPGGQRFWGGYLSASWMVTGESRPYSRTRGIFTRLSPERNFSFKGGGGALELAARYSVVDLDSAPVHGGKMRTFTAGLNWYLNSNLKLRLNWVAARSDLPGPTARLSAAQMRLEVDF